MTTISLMSVQGAETFLFARNFVLCESHTHGKCITKLKSEDTRPSYSYTHTHAYIPTILITVQLNEHDDEIMWMARHCFALYPPKMVTPKKEATLRIFFTPNVFHRSLRRIRNGRTKSDIEQFIDYSKTIQVFRLELNGEKCEPEEYMVTKWMGCGETLL